MAYTTIDKPSDYFNTVLGTGTGSTQSITGVGFQPDWLWIKRRNGAINHALYDVIRGGTNALRSNTSSAESQFATDTVITFESDGFEIAGGTSLGFNGSGDTFVSWNWLGGGTASSNTDGSITTQVSANTTAGFSILTYTGNGTAGATIGHGLNQAPEAFISKVRNQTNQWHCGFAPLGWTQQILLDLNNAPTSEPIFNNTDPDSSVVTLGSLSGTNWSGNTFVAYCFHSVKGYSKIGKYTGNGSTDGTFVYTGFKPAFVMVKRTDSADDWQINDATRDSFNLVGKKLIANGSDAEVDNSNNSFDFLSNGFKARGSQAQTNASGGTYIYMAFAENPFVTSTGIPGTAR